MRKIAIIGSEDFGTTIALSLMMKKQNTCTCLPPVKNEPCREPFTEFPKTEVKPFKVQERDSVYRQKLFSNKKRYKKVKPNNKKR